MQISTLDIDIELNIDISSDIDTDKTAYAKKSNST